MSSKHTFIGGFHESGEQKTAFLYGHWNLESAVRYGRERLGLQVFNIEHSVLAEKGRGGHDGRWAVNGDTVTQTAMWKEGTWTLTKETRQ